MHNFLIWRSVLKQKDNIVPITCSNLPWTECEWVITGLAYTLKNQSMYTLAEYSEHLYPQIGLVQIIITEDELIQYFFEVRKR